MGPIRFHLLTECDENTSTHPGLAGGRSDCVSTVYSVTEYDRVTEIHSPPHLRRGVTRDYCDPCPSLHGRPSETFIRNQSSFGLPLPTNRRETRDDGDPTPVTTLVPWLIGIRREDPSQSNDSPSIPPSRETTREYCTLHLTADRDRVRRNTSE